MIWWYLKVEESRKWGLVRRLAARGVLETQAVSGTFLPPCFLTIMRWAAPSHYTLYDPASPQCLKVVPSARLLKPRAKYSFPSFKCFRSCDSEEELTRNPTQCCSLLLSILACLTGRRAKPLPESLLPTPYCLLCSLDWSLDWTKRRRCLRCWNNYKVTSDVISFPLTSVSLKLQNLRI